MTKKQIIILVVLVALVLGVVMFSNSNSGVAPVTPTNSKTTTTKSTNNSTKTINTNPAVINNPDVSSLQPPAPPKTPLVAPNTQPYPAPSQKSFTINADDNSADVTKINVNNGDAVTLTFNVSALTTYHGGLEFRSSYLNTGVIGSGASKTVEFTATDSFSLVPYWPQSNIKKDYTIDIVVKK